MRARHRENTTHGSKELPVSPYRRMKMEEEEKAKEQRALDKRIAQERKEVEKELSPPSQNEKEAALERATLADQRELQRKTEETAEAIAGASQHLDELSPHARAELGLEDRPVKPSEEAKEVQEQMADTKKELTGDKSSKSASSDTLKNPAEKARTSPTEGPKTTEGPMFKKRRGRNKK